MYRLFVEKKLHCHAWILRVPASLLRCQVIQGSRRPQCDPQVFAIENGHRNSGFLPLKVVIFHGYDVTLCRILNILSLQLHVSPSPNLRRLFGPQRFCQYQTQPAAQNIKMPLAARCNAVDPCILCWSLLTSTSTRERRCQDVLPKLHHEVVVHSPLSMIQPWKLDDVKILHGLPGLPNVVFPDNPWSAHPQPRHQPEIWRCQYGRIELPNMKLYCQLMVGPNFESARCQDGLRGLRNVVAFLPKRQADSCQPQVQQENAQAQGSHWQLHSAWAIFDECLQHFCLNR